MNTIKKDVSCLYDKSLAAQLESRLCMFAKNIALIDEEQNLTYEELHSQAVNWGRRWLSQGLISSSPVVLCLSRGIELVTAVLACTLQGIPWLLLNPNWSESKKNDLIRLVGPQGLITNGLICELMNNSSARCLAHEVAYLATSSGSSGEMKCAIIPESGLLALMINQCEFFQLAAGTKVLQAASPGFDAVVSEVMVTIWSGATLVIPQVTNESLVKVFDGLMGDGKIDFVTLTPSVARLIKPSSLGRLSTLVLAGEAAEPGLVASLLGKVRVLNAYGPCEVSVCSHMSEIINANAVTCIGKPLKHIDTRVVDEFGNDVIPEGFGELWLYGEAVGLGYLDGGDGPFSVDERTGRRCYRTGDIVRLDRDGMVFFLGRLDDQIKIRGQKVNLNLINSAALAMNGVECAQAVVVKSRDQDQIVLFYAGATGEMSLADYLKGRLSSVDRPKRILRLPAMPLNANGKIDLLYLKTLAVENQVTAVFENEESQEDPNLAQAQKIWQHVVGAFAKGPEDDFFDAGGDSLMIVEICAKFEELTGREFPIEQFIHAPNFQMMVELSKENAIAPSSSVDVLSPNADAISTWKLLNQNIESWPLQKNRAERASKTVVLTGATGKVGRAMLETLLTETDAQILCLGRSPVRDGDEAGFSGRVESVLVDFGNAEALQIALSELMQSKKVDSIVHGAAAVNHVTGFADLYRVNVAATAQLLTFARDSGARFIYLSSLSSAEPGNSEATGYEQTKGAAEQLVISARNRGLDSTILRLPLVYDLEAATHKELTRDHFLSRIQECIRSGVRPQVDARIPAISAKDCSVITVALMQNLPTLDQDYDLLIDDGTHWNDLFLLLVDEEKDMTVATYVEWRRLFLKSKEKSPLRVFASLYQDGAPYADSLMPSIERNQKATDRLRTFVSRQPNLSIEPSATIILKALDLLSQSAL